ncbi:MAG: pyrimidine dimer DNA glycosylase/endonuclease V [Synergistaceae bacterium]
MNIFATDKCPVESAKALPNILVNKMIVESAQLLSTAHYVLDKNMKGYKATHINHPCAKWCRESKGNYDWLFNHFDALCDEYEARNGKTHKSSELKDILSVCPSSIAQKGVTEFAKAMPDTFKEKGSAIDCYIAYLISKFEGWETRTDKRKITPSWGCRNAPKWLRR